MRNLPITVIMNRISESPVFSVHHPHLFEGNRIIQQIHGNLDALHDDEKVDDKQVTERFFGLAGREVSSYCGDKSAFLGPYHGYGDPVGVTSGQLENTLSNNGNSCGALSCTVSLAPEESKTILFILGMKSSDEAARILSSYTDPSVQLEAEIDALKEDWYEKLDHLQIHTPDPAFNTMINTWNATTALSPLSGQGPHLSYIADLETDMVTGTPSRISRESFIWILKWPVTKSVLCFLLKSITAADFHL